MKDKDFQELKSSLGEALDHAQGQITLRTKRVAIPEKPAPMSSRKIKQVRAKLGVSQSVFAKILNVSRETAISWEQGRREPSGAALKLLNIAEHNPDVLLEA